MTAARWAAPLHRGFAVALLGAVLALGTPAGAAPPNGVVVYQSDFGLEDGAVAAMHGVARGVDRGLVLEDLTHLIPPFDIWAGAYRLAATVPYWPAGTVFVSVVDPGVGTDRRAVVARTGSGHYVVTPDNGTLTLVADQLGIEAARAIDEAVNRLPGSEGSYTFHGRDVFSYTAARLAAGAIGFDEIGPELPPETLVRIAYQRPVLAGGTVRGTIPILDVRYGNVWTNIDRGTFEEGLGAAGGEEFRVRVLRGDAEVYADRVPYVDTFGDVPEGAPLLYLNSVGNVALAINLGDFAAAHGVASGPEWRVEIRR